MERRFCLQLFAAGAENAPAADESTAASFKGGAKEEKGGKETSQRGKTRAVKEAALEKEESAVKEAALEKEESAVKEAAGENEKKPEKEAGGEKEQSAENKESGGEEERRRDFIKRLTELFPDIKGEDEQSLIKQWLEKIKAVQEKPQESRRERILHEAQRLAEKKACERLLDSWERQGEELKKTYPGFSLEKAMREDAGFQQLIKAGVGVKLAFEAANFEQILSAVLKNAAAQANRKLAEAVRENSRRAQENSMLDRASAVRRIDVKSLNEKEILKIINDVGKGAKISF